MMDAAGNSVLIIFLSVAAVLVPTVSSECEKSSICICNTLGKNATVIRICENDAFDSCSHLCSEVDHHSKHWLQKIFPTDNPFLLRNIPVKNPLDFVNLFKIPSGTSDGSSTCFDLSSPNHGSLSYAITDNNERISIGRCAPGFTFSGEGSKSELILTCKGGDWKPMFQFPNCVPSYEVTCQDPGGVPNAERLNIDGNPQTPRQYKVGQSVLYICFDGYALHGRSLIRCSSDGLWSQRKPTCTSISSRNPTSSSGSDIRTCDDPGFIRNGIRRNNDGTESNYKRRFQLGESVIFVCISSNYLLKGSSLLVCIEGGTWSKPIPQCVEKLVIRTPNPNDCANPGSITNGQILYIPTKLTDTPTGDDLEELDFPKGTILHYSCIQGYVLEGPITLECINSGQWSENPPICIPAGRRNVANHCKNPSSFKNGYFHFVHTQRNSEISKSHYLPGSQLEFFCNSGYILEGSRYIICATSGKWSPELPECTSVIDTDFIYCDNPGSIPNANIVEYYPFSSSRSADGMKTALELPKGTKLQYSCDDGYFLEGPKTITCEAMGLWSENPPICKSDCGHSLFDLADEKNKTGVAAGEWPWYVVIAVETKNVTLHYCAGALLNSRTVVTVAHCVTENEKYTLFFGMIKMDFKNRSEDTVRKVASIVIHPNFNKINYDSDIALITLDRKIKFTEDVQPICLPTAKTTAKNLMTGKMGYVLGWGMNITDLSADKLLLTRFPVHSNEDCMETFKKKGVSIRINQHMFCAGITTGQNTICMGDSGSPLVFYDIVTQRFTMEGLVSFGFGTCGPPENYDVFTKVYEFLPWILRQIS